MRPAKPEFITVHRSDLSGEAADVQVAHIVTYNNVPGESGSIMMLSGGINRQLVETREQVKCLILGKK